MSGTSVSGTKRFRSGSYTETEAGRGADGERTVTGGVFNLLIQTSSNFSYRESSGAPGAQVLGA